MACSWSACLVVPWPYGDRSPDATHCCKLTLYTTASSGNDELNSKRPGRSSQTSKPGTTARQTKTSAERDKDASSADVRHSRAIATHP